jgi:hypothetical protein
MDIDLSPVTEARGISNGTKTLSVSQHAPTQEAETDKHGEFQAVKPGKKKS